MSSPDSGPHRARAPDLLGGISHTGSPLQPEGGVPVAPAATASDFEFTREMLEAESQEFDTGRAIADKKLTTLAAATQLYDSTCSGAVNTFNTLAEKNGGTFVEEMRVCMKTLASATRTPPLSTTTGKWIAGYVGMGYKSAITNIPQEFVTTNQGTGGVSWSDNKIWPHIKSQIYLVVTKGTTPEFAPAKALFDSWMDYAMWIKVGEKIYLNHRKAVSAETGVVLGSSDFFENRLGQLVRVLSLMGVKQPEVVFDKVVLDAILAEKDQQAKGTVGSREKVSVADKIDTSNIFIAAAERSPGEAVTPLRMSLNGKLENVVEEVVEPEAPKRPKSARKKTDEAGAEVKKKKPKKLSQDQKIENANEGFGGALAKLFPFTDAVTVKDAYGNESLALCTPERVKKMRYVFGQIHDRRDEVYKLTGPGVYPDGGAELKNITHRVIARLGNLGKSFDDAKKINIPGFHKSYHTLLEYIIRPTRGTQRPSHAETVDHGGNLDDLEIAIQDAKAQALLEHPGDEFSCAMTAEVKGSDAWVDSVLMSSEEFRQKNNWVAVKSEANVAQRTNVAAVTAAGAAGAAGGSNAAGAAGGAAGGSKAAGAAGGAAGGSKAVYHAGTMFIEID